MIREDLYCTTQDYSEVHYYTSPEKLLAELDSKTTIGEIPSLLKSFMDGLTSIATLPSGNTTMAIDDYWLQITNFLQDQSDVISVTDEIRVLTPVPTAEGSVFPLTGYGYPVLLAGYKQEPMAVIEPYRIPLTECRLSLFSNRIKKYRATGNLKLLNTKMPLSANIFLLGEEQTLIGLLFPNSFELVSLFERLDAEFMNFIMVPKAFSKLLRKCGSISEDTFLACFDDLLEEARIATAWSPKKHQVLERIEHAKENKPLIQKAFTSINNFSMQMTGQQFLEQVQHEHPDDWQAKLLQIGINCVAFSSDTTSISAQRGKPTVDSYLFLDKELVTEVETVELTRHTLAQSKQTSLYNGDIAFTNICRRIVHIDAMLEALLIAKYYPNQINSPDNAPKTTAFIKLFGLANLPALEGDGENNANERAA